MTYVIHTLPVRLGVYATLALALVVAGCGDDAPGDDAGNGDADHAHDAGHDAGPAAPHDGGHGEPALDAGSAAACVEAAAGQGIDQRCALCQCTTCPMQAEACDEGCWAAIACVFEYGCLADQATELSCITSNCSEHSASFGKIAALDACIIQMAPDVADDAGLARACTAECEEAAAGN